MAMTTNPKISLLSSLCSCAIFSFVYFYSNADELLKREDEPTEDIIVVSERAASAEDMLKQQLGASIITSKEIENSTQANGLSDIIRRQPGVNLTGNATSGSRGNNQQIDIRGMEQENTLILIDGKPVTSRNSVRYSWSGERDSRGDSNWFPVEQVERIEVLRGPSAARYGPGASGGVVNIFTKKATNEWGIKQTLINMV